MNAPAEITTPSPDYLRVLEALVQINEPAERDHIARRAGISPDGAGVQLVALADKRIVVRCPQPKGAPALWSLAVSLSTVCQMVAGMKRAAAETGPAADDRRRIIAAMREIGAPASAFAIAKKSGVEMSNFSLFLEEMAADGVIRRIGGTSGQRPRFALAPPVQSLMPTATDGEPGDGSPDEDHEDEETAAAADPDDYGDDEIPPAAAYAATVEAEAAADEAPLAGEDVNGEADVLKDRCERYTDPVEAAADQIAAAVAAGQCPTVGMLFGGSGPGVVYGPIKQSPSAALDPLLHRTSPVTEEAAQRAIDTAEVEALMREEEADIALEMARDARVRGRAVAELIRFAEQRTGLAGDADPGAVLAAIVELLDGARSAVTGMSRPA